MTGRANLSPLLLLGDRGGGILYLDPGKGSYLPLLTPVLLVARAGLRLGPTLCPLPVCYQATGNAGLSWTTCFPTVHTQEPPL